MKNRVVTVRVDDKLADLLDELRDEHHINISDLVRHILMDALFGREGNNR